MNFSAWSIRNPVPAILLFVLLTVGGLLAFERLAVQNFPDMDLPTIKITATLEGAAPSQLETEVARKIEDNLASLSLLDHITTTITDGSVSISVSFKLEKDSEEALNEVRNAVGSTTNLPSAMQSPSVTKVKVQGSPLITYAVRSARLNETELSWFVDNDMTKALLSVSGVGEVGRIGGIDREVHVDLNPQIMGSLGLTAATVSSRLKSVQADSSGGRGEIGGGRQSIRTLGAVASIEELKALTIPLPSGKLVRLDEIGMVTDSFSDRSSLAYLDGQPVIGVQVKRSNGVSDTGVAAAIQAAMQDFTAANPDVEIVEAYSTVGPIIENYDGSMHMLYEGAILAVVVVWLFLRDWRATFLSAVALPLSVIPTFLAMYFADFSLNTVTLLALSLVVGILVDDAIVEVENIARHLNMGKSPMDAALEAADEIGLAVIATTFTLVAVFLPTAFMSGIPGLIFRQFGVTAAVAVLASLLVARLLTPMMAAYMMKARPSEEKDGLIMRAYMESMKACLSHRKLTVLGVCVFLGLSLSTIPFLKSGFMPASDDAQTKVTLTLQPGSTIEQTDAATRRAVDIITKLPHVTRVFSSVGSASSGGGLDASTTSDVASATLVVNLASIGDRDRKQSEIENDIRQALAVLPGVRVELGSGAMEQRSRSRLPVTIPMPSTRQAARWRNSCALLRASAPLPPVPHSKPQRSRSCPILRGRRHSASRRKRFPRRSALRPMAITHLRWQSSTCRNGKCRSACGSIPGTVRHWRTSPISASVARTVMSISAPSPTFASAAARPRSTALTARATSPCRSSSTAASSATSTVKRRRCPRSRTCRTV